jgi:RNA polymerase sigma factor (sigma-70 family)
VSGVPPELRALLEAQAPLARDEAWGQFVERFSPLLLHTARVVAREHDRAMDCYTHLLEQLRADECRRLRRYAEDSRSRFTTWLVVVARGVCIDFLRQRYGRIREQSAEARSDQASRRRLADLLVEEIDTEQSLPDPAAAPDAPLRREQLAAALASCLAALTPAERLLLAYRFEDNLPARVIATRLRYPTPFHVYRALNALLQSLRGRLASQGVDDPEP